MREPLRWPALILTLGATAGYEEILGQTQLQGKSAEGCHNGATHSNETVSRPTEAGSSSNPWK